MTGREILPSAANLKGKGRADEDELRQKLGGMLSDWHLIAFLDTCGILDEVSALSQCYFYKARRSF